MKEGTFLYSYTETFAYSDPNKNTQTRTRSYTFKESCDFILYHFFYGNNEYLHDSYISNSEMTVSGTNITKGKELKREYGPNGKLVGIYYSGHAEKDSTISITQYGGTNNSYITSVTFILKTS